MSPNAIQLQCPNCGAQLQITSDLETFACAYCSTTILVHREGGVVSLQRMEATLGQVRDTTEKAAAELALARYEKELAHVEALYNQLDSTNSSDIGKGIGGGGLLTLLGLFFVYRTSGEGVAPYVLLIVGLYLLARGAAAYRSSAASRLLPQIQLLKAKIEERKRIAES